MLRAFERARVGLAHERNGMNEYQAILVIKFVQVISQIAESGNDSFWSYGPTFVQ